MIFNYNKDGITSRVLFINFLHLQHNKRTEASVHDSAMFLAHVYKSVSNSDVKSPTWRRIRIRPASTGDRRRRGDLEEAGVKALNDEDDYVSRVSHGELEFMSSLNSARFLPCSLH